MSLYEQWISVAYNRNGQSEKKLWDLYMPLEQKIYENMIGTKDKEIKGSVTALAKTYNMPVHYICGFLDGVKEAVEGEIDVENLTEETVVDVTVDFEKLYRKMVEYKAEHLYSLPEWDNVFTEEERKEMYVDQKKAGTFIREEKVGRNDPCPCGSGKKYKKCCGALQ